MSTPKSPTALWFNTLIRLDVSLTLQDKALGPTKFKAESSCQNPSESLPDFRRHFRLATNRCKSIASAFAVYVYMFHAHLDSYRILRLMGFATLCNSTPKHLMSLPTRSAQFRPHRQDILSDMHTRTHCVTSLSDSSSKCLQREMEMLFWLEIVQLYWCTRSYDVVTNQKTKIATRLMFDIFFMYAPAS